MIFDVPKGEKYRLKLTGGKYSDETAYVDLELWLLLVSDLLSILYIKTIADNLVYLTLSIPQSSLKAAHKAFR